MLKKAILLFPILCMLVIMVSCGGNPVIPPVDEEGNIQITNMFWDSDDKVIEITLNQFPSTWGNWTMYIDGEKLPMEGGNGKPVIAPNAPLDKPPTGLFVGTLPWVSPLTEVDFPCCGTIQFDIPGEGFTNEYEFNLINFGCETASEEECTQTPIPEPEGEVFFVTDTNPENDLILLAGIEGGEKIVTLGEKDGSGNPISITGALYLTGQGEGLAIEVDNNGLPARVVDSDGNKFTFENYTDSTVDISIYDFEENLIEGPLTIEIDPDDINRMQQLYQSFYSKSRWDAHNTADIFEYTSVAIGFVGCGVSIFAAVFTGGFAIPVAAIACSSAMYNAYTVSHPNDPILTNTEGTTLNITGNILNVVFINKFTPWGIAGTISGMIGSVIEAGATKMDIIEVHNEFLLAIVNQDWYEAKSLCVEGSEAYNMVCGMEISFANASFNPDNSNIEISQRIDDLSIANRPIAHMYNTAVITITTEGHDPFVYSGEEYYGYLEEVSLNKWKKAESAILKITGVFSSGPLPNPTLYDPGDAVDSYEEYTVSWSDESEHGAIDYFIKEDTSPDFDPNSPNYSGSWVEGTSKTFSHQVDQDTTYYYRVWSYAGNTVWSEPGSNIESIAVISDPFDHPEVNRPPVISDLSANPSSVDINQITTVTCSASDPDGDPLTYHWTKNAGSFEGDTSGPSVTWRAPSTEGNYSVECEVSDGKGGEDTDTLNIVVTESEEPGNGSNNEVIFDINYNPIEAWSYLNVSCNPIGATGDNLTWTWEIPYLWSKPFTTNEKDWIWWTAPGHECTFTIYCTINDGINEYSGSLEVEVVITHEADTEEIISVIQEFELAMNNLNWEKAKSCCIYESSLYDNVLSWEHYIYPELHLTPDFDVDAISIENMCLIVYEPMFFYDDGLIAYIFFTEGGTYEGEGIAVYDAKKINNTWKLGK